MKSTDWSPTRSGSHAACATTCAPWPAISADVLERVGEPAAAWQPMAARRSVEDVVASLRSALTGCHDGSWRAPHWLLPHQRTAACRLAGALQAFGGAMLADAVGLGKSYVALALATRYPRTVVLAPAAIRTQWGRLATGLRVPVDVLSHEAASRGTGLPDVPFVVIDEAHRFRNASTRRYDHVCRTVRNARLLLLTATPVVNHTRDLVHLLRLFLPDHALAPLGVGSLHDAAEHNHDAMLRQAVAPLIVARTAATARCVLPMPRPETGRVVPAAPIRPRALSRVVRMFERLRFPSFGAEAAELLRVHLLYRLASSRAAGVETLSRHDNYLRRAIAAARRGESLPRRAQGLLQGRDDQLELALLTAVAEPIPAARFVAERLLIRQALALLAGETRSPKTARLVRLLREENAEKSIVFTSATATALELADALGWHRLAVATARGAKIASGSVGLDDVLDYFAPRARHRAAPPPGLALDLLIATDLASEGLDLHDASRIVHYDLPWTPFRLEQRLGRLVRLGSLHRRVRVYWFVPPPELDRRLRLTGRIQSKADTQLRSAVPATAHVGRVRVENELMTARERLAEIPPAPLPGWAVVSGPRVALVGLSWQVGQVRVRQVITLPAGEPAETIERLSRLPPSRAGLPGWCNASVGSLMSARIRLADRGSTHAVTRQLVLRVLRHARAAAVRRDPGLIALLDGVLSRLHGGLTEGDERALRDSLDRRYPASALRQWLARARDSLPPWNGPEVEALLVGTGHSICYPS